MGRAVAAGAEQGLDQSFLAWLWSLLGGDAGPLLTQLEADGEVDDAYMICMTEVRRMINSKSNPVCYVPSDAEFLQPHLHPNTTTGTENTTICKHGSPTPCKGFECHRKIGRRRHLTLLNSPSLIKNT